MSIIIQISTVFFNIDFVISTGFDVDVGNEYNSYVPLGMEPPRPMAPYKLTGGLLGYIGPHKIFSLPKRFHFEVVCAAGMTLPDDVPPPGRGFTCAGDERVGQV